MNPKVDWYFDKSQKWQKEVRKLRSIILGTGLTEELRWGCPCYTTENHNIVLIHEFKDYCAVLFFKGALLSDKKGILIQQTKNVQAARQMRFTGLQDVIKKESALKAYIKEALKVELAGLKVEYKKTAEFEMPEEFQNRLSKVTGLDEAFYGLTPGRQRGYLLYFSSAKQSKTRQARIDRFVPRILKGKGLED